MKGLWDIPAVPPTQFGKSLRGRKQQNHEDSIVHRHVVGLRYNHTGSNTDVRVVFKWSVTDIRGGTGGFETQIALILANLIEVFAFSLYKCGKNC